MNPGDINKAASYFHSIIRFSRGLGTYLPIGPVLNGISIKVLEEMARLEVDAIDKVGEEFWLVYEDKAKKWPKMPNRKKLEKEYKQKEKDYCIKCGKTHVEKECPK